MRLEISFQNNERTFEVAGEAIVVGRPRVGSADFPDLDLSPDLTVSRPHARLWRERETWMLEDLNSTHGTCLNGEEIQGRGARPLASGDLIQIGETCLKVDAVTHAFKQNGATPNAVVPTGALNKHLAAHESRPPVAPAPSNVPHQKALPQNELAGIAKNGVPPSGAPVIVPRAAGSEREGRITVSFNAAQVAAAHAAAVHSAAQKESEKTADARETSVGETAADETSRFALLHELLLDCGLAQRLDDVLQSVVERLISAVGAARGALLRERDGALLLRAFHSSGGPVVSETLARRAMQEGVGFIWKRDDHEHGGSIAHYRIESGMYAPLMWQDKALGVLCVDSPFGEFSPEDLRLLISAAHLLSLAIANEGLQEELRRESAIKANLLRQFSPQIAEQLLTHGTLQLSGERSEVTILCSDIRGFTALTKNMEPIEVVEMLNDYFSRLIPIIFAHGGTVDKYIGDAILAIFGSPKKDPKQHENAVRAALEMQKEMLKSNAARESKNKAVCQIGIGVHSGEVLHGFIGASDRMELTVIGDAVNRATRFCDGARGGDVVISPQLYQWVWKMAQIEAVQITTKHGETLPAFRVLEMQDAPEELA